MSLALNRIAQMAGKRYTPLQASLIDRQVVDTLANKAGNRLVLNSYTKPMLASTVGLGLGGGLLLGPTARTSLFGAQGLMGSLAKSISPETYNLAVASTGSLASPASSVLGNMGAAYLPFKAALSIPGHALASGLTAAGAKAGAGTMLGSALTGAGTAISGGFLAPAIGTLASLYALKKGGQMAARAMARRGAAARQMALQQGRIAEGTKGYDNELIRNLGLRLIK
jgi:hypothetical protein